MTSQWQTRLSIIPLLFTFSVAHACGGFFCQFDPINQAGEQIIFHQQGSTTTTMVQIQYVGSSENFAWVLPVPALPTLSTGSDLLFSSLETLTRPQFNLERRGEVCLGDMPPISTQPGTNTEVIEDGGVTVVDAYTVGPYDVQIVTSDDPTAMATWLQTNNFDLSTQGNELLTPYIEAGMLFVVLKLRQNQGVGDIQPLILQYQSTQPMIPIRLTAVATVPNMGILVWLLGSARAVPLNYLHVVPNYTRLNWYNGTRSAYASYQALITTAMDEAGGQGFATDFAGHISNITNQLPTLEQYNSELNQISETGDDALFISLLANNRIFPQTKIVEILRRVLPLPLETNESSYAQASVLNSLFSAQQLSDTRQTLITDINASIISTLSNSLELFANDPYITRLYTTLSADEMTLDPIFDFNPDMPTQSRTRNAVLQSSCNNDKTNWQLTLGSGTGRDGQVVLSGEGGVPTNTLGTSQNAVWRTETTNTSGSPEVVTQNTFPSAQLEPLDRIGFGALGISTLLILIMLISRGYRQKIKRRIK